MCSWPSLWTIWPTHRNWPRYWSHVTPFCFSSCHPMFPAFDSLSESLRLCASPHRMSRRKRRLPVRRLPCRKPRRSLKSAHCLLPTFPLQREFSVSATAPAFWKRFKTLSDCWLGFKIQTFCISEKLYSEIRAHSKQWHSRFASKWVSAMAN